MKLKTYTANSMAQALAEVKKDLGKDAVILHTRVHKAGAVMGIGGRQVVEITASDQAAARRPAASQVPTRAEASSFSPTRFQSVRTEPLAPAVVETKPVSSPVPLAVRVEPAPVDAEGLASLREDLAAIKRLVGQALANASGKAAGPAPDMPVALSDLYTRLREDGLRPEIADAIASGVRDELSAAELSDPDVARSAVVRHVGNRIQTVGVVSKAGLQPDNRPLTIALVGPTGVGKTTTIAKLAAAYKLRLGKRVGLVTCDTYRIAAVEQLRTYAGIISIPLKVAISHEEVAEACRSLHDCDVIILDTPGRSQHDSARLDELAACVDAARPHETHLVLSASVAEGVLGRAAELFTRVKPDRLVITKLDEAVQFAPIVNLAGRTGLRLSFVTTGQEVPDHIELASAARLASLVVDGRAALERSEAVHA
ncbi:Flagellar biosynthesis protein FlhF [Phycisphaerales bacterium]|nr:Flagellar biosynthesis protein FlhF [Phycisphaerales bacterium]